jgi:hypothetical protein
VERKRLLCGAIPAQPSPVLFVDHVAETGVALYRAVCERDMEGVVAKLASGLYTPEATTWVKIENPAYSHAIRRRPQRPAASARFAPQLPGAALPAGSDTRRMFWFIPSRGTRLRNSRQGQRW